MMLKKINLSQAARTHDLGLRVTNGAMRLITWVPRQIAGALESRFDFSPKTAVKHFKYLALLSTVSGLLAGLYLLYSKYSMAALVGELDQESLFEGLERCNDDELCFDFDSILPSTVDLEGICRGNKTILSLNGFDYLARLLYQLVPQYLHPRSEADTLKWSQVFLPTGDDDLRLLSSVTQDVHEDAANQSLAIMYELLKSVCGYYNEAVPNNGYGSYLLYFLSSMAVFPLAIGVKARGLLKPLRRVEKTFELDDLHTFINNTIFKAISLGFSHVHEDMNLEPKQTGLVKKIKSFFGFKEKKAMTFFDLPTELVNEIAQFAFYEDAEKIEALIAEFPNFKQVLKFDPDNVKVLDYLTKDCIEKPRHMLYQYTGHEIHVDVKMMSESSNTSISHQRVTGNNHAKTL